MATTATVQVASVAPIAASTPMKKKAPATKTKSAAAAAAHPSTALMVVEAIRELNEKKGSSLSAIKKYMSTNFKVDSTKHAPFIRKFLKAAVVKGALVQTNGTGAMGHFKLPVAPKKKPVVAKKKIAAKKPAKAASVGTPKKRKSVAKKAPTAAEPAAKNPKTVAAKPKKSLGKAKKPVMASKPPKVKKTTVVKKVKSPKKK